MVILRDKFISKSEALLQNQSATQICVVMRQQYGFSALVLQTSFRGETRVGSGRLFFQARRKRTTKSTSAGNNREVQPTRTNRNGSRVDLIATFVFRFVLFLYDYKRS